MIGFIRPLSAPPCPVDETIVIYKGTTPTITFALPRYIDLSIAEKMYVTFSDTYDKRLFTKVETPQENEALHLIEGNIVTVDLTQEETFLFPLEGAKAQLNWIYDSDGVTKRGASDHIQIKVENNLLKEVINSE